MHYLAQKLARNLKAHSEQTADEDVIRYGAEVALGALFQLSIFMAAAYLCGLFYEMAGILAASALLRRYSGGAHCSKYYRCTLSGLFTYLFLAYLLRYISPEYYIFYLTAAALVCYGLIYRLAPVDNPAKRIIDPIQRRRLRNKSYAVVTVLLLLSVIFRHQDCPVMALALLLGLLWQSFTLTSGGGQFIAAWDRFLLRIEILLERRKHDAPAA